MKGDCQSVIERLEAYDSRFEELLGMLEHLPLSSEKRAQVQEKLKTLKEKLAADYKAGSTVRGQEQMDEVERACFFPAIHQAYAEINIRWNSIPNQAWFDQLYGARINISHMLEQLKSS